MVVWLSDLRSAYRKELHFYRQYHQHPVNWRMHAVLVPVEWTAWLLLLAPLGLHWPLALLSAAYYLFLDCHLSLVSVFVAAASAQMLFALTAHHAHLALYGYGYGSGSASVAVAMQAVAWVLQVCVGHWLIEGNNPAMASALTCNAVLLSPLMAWDYTSTK